MKNGNKVAAIVTVIWIPVALGLSYGLARLGHPNSLWFWRDLLGVIPG